MRQILRKCLHCGIIISGIPEKDNLGYYMYCPECDSTFDIDIVDYDELSKYLNQRINKNVVYEKHHKNPDIFICKICVHHELYNILRALFHPMDELLYNNGSYQPYIEILYDVDYDPERKYDDKAFCIELHQYKNTIRITDLILCQHIKNVIKEMIEDKK